MRKHLIVCLPVAGIENPYQKLMMEGLNESGQLHAVNGIDDRFFGIIRSGIKYKPEYIHFDWIVSYYYRRWKWLTLVSIPVFFFQIWVARHLLRIRFVWTLHNIYPHDIGQRRLHIFCQKFMAKNCEWIRVFGEETARKAMRDLKIPMDNIKILPEGDYTTFYPNTSTRDSSRKFLDIPDHFKVFLFIGFIRPYKGITELIDAFTQSSNSQNLLIIGGQIKDKHYGDQIVSRTYANIRIIPEFIPPDKLQFYFHAADAVILPFLSIDNSGSVIMAMGFSKPIIGPLSGTLVQRLEQQTELLFNTHDELSEKIQYTGKLSQVELESIGRKNLEALKKSGWTDFEQLFL